MLRQGAVYLVESDCFLQGLAYLLGQERYENRRHDIRPLVVQQRGRHGSSRAGPNSSRSRSDRAVRSPRRSSSAAEMRSWMSCACARSLSVNAKTYSLRKHCCAKRAEEFSRTGLPRAGGPPSLACWRRPTADGGEQVLEFEVVDYSGTWSSASSMPRLPIARGALGAEQFGTAATAAAAASARRIYGRRDCGAPFDQQFGTARSPCVMACV